MTDSTESQTDSSEKLSESGMMTKDSTALGRGSDVICQWLRLKNLVILSTLCTWVFVFMVLCAFL
jgi:hypothetical protein